VPLKREMPSGDKEKQVVNAKNGSILSFFDTLSFLRHEKAGAEAGFSNLYVATISIVAL